MMRSRRGLLCVCLAVAALSLSGCEFFESLDIFGGSSGNKRPLQGQRLPVLPEEHTAEVDSRLAGLSVVIPEAVANSSWPQAGGNAAHNLHHLAASGLTVAWRTGVGTSSSRNGFISSSPIVVDGRVFVVDAEAAVSAYDAQNGRRLWRFGTEPRDARSEGAGGGVAFDGGRIYVTSGFAQVLALDPATGQEMWRAGLTAPARAGATVSEGRVYVLSVDNQVNALDAATGRRLWSYSATAENAGFYGNASPAAEGNVLIAAFSSGEIFALRGDTGRVLWSDALTGLLRTDAISALADIRGLPIIDRGQVMVVSNGGRMAALELRTGGRIWEREVGSRVHPWVAGDFVFVTTGDAQLVAMTRRDGRIRWAQQLPQFLDEERRRNRIDWTGPVLAGGRLIVAGTNEELLAIDPANGSIAARVALPGPVRVSPVVAGGTIFVLTESADLVALR